MRLDFSYHNTSRIVPKRKISLSLMVTSIFYSTHIDQQILITIEKQDILALQKRDTLPWGLQTVIGATRTD